VRPLFTWEPPLLRHGALVVLTFKALRGERRELCLPPASGGSTEHRAWAPAGMHHVTADAYGTCHRPVCLGWHEI
jgi:hypothetical protein